MLEKTAILTLFLVGCGSGGAMVSTEEARSTPPAEPTSVPDRPCEGSARACAIRDEVRALVAQSVAGSPARVVRSVATTYGWGCVCPAYVDARTPIEASEPEQFVLVDPSSPSAPPARPDYFGRFRVRGHYSGEWARGPSGETAPPFRYPTFVVESWCYEGPMRRARRELPRCPLSARGAP